MVPNREKHHTSSHCNAMSSVKSRSQMDAVGPPAPSSFQFTSLIPNPLFDAWQVLMQWQKVSPCCTLATISKEICLSIGCQYSSVGVFIELTNNCYQMILSESNAILPVYVIKNFAEIGEGDNGFSVDVFRTLNKMANAKILQDEMLYIVLDDPRQKRFQFLVGPPLLGKRDSNEITTGQVSH